MLLRPHTFLREEEGGGEPQPTGGIGGGGPAPAAPASPTGTMDFGSEDTFKAFVGSLPQEQQDMAMFQDTKSFSSLVDQTLNAQSALGKKRLEAPNENWGDEDWTNFHSNVRPETTDGYTFAESYDVAQGDTTVKHSLSEGDVTELRSVSDQLNLSPQQANKLGELWAGRSVDATGTLDGQIAETVTAQQRALQNEWADNYEINHKSANEAFEILAEKVPELRDLMGWSPIVENHPATMKLFHMLAPLVQDAGMISGGQGGGFGGDTVAGIQAQIKDFDSQNEQIIMADPDKLSIGDKLKRDDLLKQRTALYQKLHPKS